MHIDDFDPSLALLRSSADRRASVCGAQDGLQSSSDCLWQIQSRYWYHILYLTVGCRLYACLCNTTCLAARRSVDGSAPNLYISSIVGVVVLH